MEIKNYGGSVIELSHKRGSLLINPFWSQFGIKPKKVSAGVVLCTDQEAAEGITFGDNQFVVNTPGEYEINEAAITAIPARRHIDGPDEQKRSILYSVLLDGITIGIIGNVDPKIDEQQFEKIGLVNVLIIPVVGKGMTLDGLAAARIARELEPKIIIPVHFDDGLASYEVPQDPIDVFAKELGITPLSEDKLKITATSLPENMEIHQITPIK